MKVNHGALASTYQMLWGALFTVRRMVMRPPKSPTPRTRSSRRGAVPRKLVVWWSADAAIPRCVSEINWWLVFEWKCPAGEVDLYTATEMRGAKLVDARRDTSAPPHWLPPRLWIWSGILRRPRTHSFVATWSQRSLASLHYPNSEQYC